MAGEDGWRTPSGLAGPHHLGSLDPAFYQARLGADWTNRNPSGIIPPFPIRRMVSSHFSTCRGLWAGQEHHRCSAWTGRQGLWKGNKVDDSEILLKALSEALGVSGHEKDVRDLVRARLKGLGCITQDKVGSLICTLENGPEAPRLMLAAHIDEIGFMVKHITKEGFLRFLPLGGWFDQALLGQRVIIQSKDGLVPGVIGAKPPHILKSEEREKVVPREEMYVDIGAGPTVSYYDIKMLPNHKLRDLFFEAASALGIPLQASVMEGGYTDGAPIHLHKAGVPTIVLGVPARHIHSHGAIMHRDDYDRALALVVEALKRLDGKKVEDLVR